MCISFGVQEYRLKTGHWPLNCYDCQVAEHKMPIVRFVSASRTVFCLTGVMGMRRVGINDVQPGMVLAKTIFSPNGNVLLSAGAELNPSYVKKLQSLGYSAVMVRESYCSGLTYPEIVSEKARNEGIATLRHIFEEVGKYKKIDTGTVKSLVGILMDEILHNRRVLFELPDIRSYDGYIYGHSVNVCIMALKMGLMLDYNELQLRDLGVGAILHDIGTVFVDRTVIDKPGRLTPAEFEKVKHHSMEGFNLLREQKDINLLSAHVAFQHHERVDGNGYPRLLRSGDICEFARIVSIADMFDALLSDRRYRRAYRYHDAVELVRKEIGRKCDPETAELFFRNIALYPVGSLVELNTGEVGLVVSNTYPDHARPVIMVVADRQKQAAEPDEPLKIDLRRQKDVHVVKPFQDEKFTARLRRIFERKTAGAMTPVHA